VRRQDPRREGIALVLAMVTVTVLGAMLADMHQSTSTAFAVAMTQRDDMRAEYLARSSVDLTRMLVMREPQIRAVIEPLYRALTQKALPQLPVWLYANEVLVPFCDFDEAAAGLSGAGIDLGGVQGLGNTGGRCSVVAVAENSKVNVNDPLNLDGDQAKRSLAMQMFALMGGYQAPSPYDPLFERRDAEGQFNTRLDIISALCDWWDLDQQRTDFDPGAATITSSGAEDDVYRRYADPYSIKNAPFDSLEEIRLVRGINDDFWATFVVPDPDDLRSEKVTIYGSGAVNPNEAPPEVLMSRLCSFLTDQPLCVDPLEAAKFIQLIRTLRMLVPVPLFPGSREFLAFLEGRGGPTDPYPLLVQMLGPQHPLLFRPVTIPADRRVQVENAFVTAARILTVQGVGRVGRSTVRVRAVVNFHDRWTPPPPNAGVMPALGVFHHYRID
jgi:general secretion pathway protein K